MVVLVPRGDGAREKALCDALAGVENVSKVMAYVTTVGPGIPVEFVDGTITDNFYSPNYARIILTCNTQEEGREAFDLVAQVREITGTFYDESYTCGQSANLYDMKNVVSSDNKISLLAIVAIGLTLMVTFKSLSIPLILLAVIESAIWINLAIPYFTGTSLSYIGFLVIHTVQLGASYQAAQTVKGTYAAVSPAFYAARDNLPELAPNAAAISTALKEMSTQLGAALENAGSTGSGITESLNMLKVSFVSPQNKRTENVSLLFRPPAFKSRR